MVKRSVLLVEVAFKGVFRTVTDAGHGLSVGCPRVHPRIRSRQLLVVGVLAGEEEAVVDHDSAGTELPAKNATLFSAFPMFVPSLSW